MPKGRIGKKEKKKKSAHIRLQYFPLRNTLFHKNPVDFLASNILWKSVKTAEDVCVVERIG